MSELEKYIDNLKLLETGKFLYGFPERWLDNATWRCKNNHVSKRYLKCDNYDRCLACNSEVRLTSPEDEED